MESHHLAKKMGLQIGWLWKPIHGGSLVSRHNSTSNEDEDDDQSYE